VREDADRNNLLIPVWVNVWTEELPVFLTMPLAVEIHGLLGQPISGVAMSGHDVDWSFGRSRGLGL
jgi:hypothetical protein